MKTKGKNGYWGRIDLGSLQRKLDASRIALQRAEQARVLAIASEMLAADAVRSARIKLEEASRRVIAGQENS